MRRIAKLKSAICYNTSGPPPISSSSSSGVRRNGLAAAGAVAAGILSEQVLQRRLTHPGMPLHLAKGDHELDRAGVTLRMKQANSVCVGRSVGRV